MQQILPTRRRTAKGFWQLTALALAAGAFCVAQAQNLGLLTDAEETMEPPEVIIEQAAAPATPTTEATEASSSEEAKPATETSVAPATQAAEPGTRAQASAQTGQTVVVTPQTASQPAMPAEDRPPTREEVVADAIYANTHGLIPRGEVAVLHEDKGMLWAEQMAQSMSNQQMAKADGSTPQRLAMR